MKHILIVSQLFICKFTTNTYLAVVLPPGEERFNAGLENVLIAKADFESLDSQAPRKATDRGISGSLE